MFSYYYEIMLVSMHTHIYFCFIIVHYNYLYTYGYLNRAFTQVHCTLALVMIDFLVTYYRRLCVGYRV